MDSPFDVELILPTTSEAFNPFELGLYIRNKLRTLERISFSVGHSDSFLYSGGCSTIIEVYSNVIPPMSTSFIRKCFI